MLHACAARFDVTENLENFLDFGVNKPSLQYSAACSSIVPPVPTSINYRILLPKLLPIYLPHVTFRPYARNCQ